MKNPSKNQTDKIEPDDAALFRAAVGEVRPLPRQDRVTPHKPSRRSLLRSPVSPPGIITDPLSNHAATDAPDEYLSNGLSRMTLRKLRRGTVPVRDRLDLHGNNSDTARRLLQEFLHEAVRYGFRCVLVIHGKGLNSRGGEAVLKMRTRHWLTQHPQVLAYCDAPAKEGGNGAALVLLRLGS